MSENLMPRISDSEAPAQASAMNSPVMTSPANCPAPDSASERAMAEREPWVRFSVERPALDGELSALWSYASHALGEALTRWLFMAAWLESRPETTDLDPSLELDAASFATRLIGASDPNAAADSFAQSLQRVLALAGGPPFVRRALQALRAPSAARARDGNANHARAILAANEVLADIASIDRTFPSVIAAIDPVLAIRGAALLETDADRLRVSLYYRSDDDAALLLDADAATRKAWQRLTGSEPVRDVTVAHVSIGAPNTRVARNAGHRAEPPTALHLPLLRSRQCVGLLRFETETPPSDDDLALLAAVASSVSIALGSSDRASIVADARLAATERSHRELLAVVSHDLRNPLSAILMSVSLMLRARHGEQHESTKSVDVIKRSAERLNLLIQNVVDASHLEEAPLLLNPSVQPAEAVLADAVRMLQAQATNRNIRLSLEIASDVSSVLCDRERIVQTLVNILHASLRFTPKGGAVTVRAGRSDEHHVHLEIQDTSPGFEPAEARRIFERTWWSERNHSLGTGLGLAVARGIVDAHGGHLTLTSAPGIGNLFAFDLRTDV